ncbi:MAG TPA: molybdopterin-synthase adenylyltransferase MoeB [Cyclobacteriaceae bacterium]|nr:molybdopterin-synthase adenylyltransferase MoeB [Cyclobacteriaceae bacterium]
MLTSDELFRYSRQLVLPDFGKQGQEKLKQAKVLVIGAGGLGAPVLLYLAAAGVGHIGIVDHDNVDISNLQRQVLFYTADIGKSKAETAATRLHELNTEIQIKVFKEKLIAENALNIIKQFDVIVDCSDNFPTRYLLNDACVLLDKVLIYASVFRYEGQLAVFNGKKSDGNHYPNYRDLFPEPPSPGTVMNCEQGGVLGVLPGLIGCMQANEVIKLIASSGDVLHGRLLIFDTLSMQQQIIRIPERNSRLQIKSLIDYEEFCGLKTKHTYSGMKEITVQELKAMKDSGEDFQLIDVREDYEVETSDIGGEWIPMGDIPENVGKISKAKKVIIHCRSGGRSGNVVQWLEKNHGFSNLYNLKGGIVSWATEIDPDMEVA